MIRSRRFSGRGIEMEGMNYPMTRTEIQSLGPNFNHLLRCLRAGEEVIIFDSDTPVAKLVPASGERVFGEFVGKIRMADDFNAPLAGSDLAEWEK